MTDTGLGLGVIPWSLDQGMCVFSGGCPRGTQIDAVAGIGLSPGTSSVVAYLPVSDLTVVAFGNANFAEVDSLVGQAMVVWRWRPLP